MSCDFTYKKYSDSLKEEYGEKVYKIPINLPVTCPNRDGNVGCSGCTFCGEDATGFESLDASLSVKEQIETNIEKIGKKYGAKKYIAYFQNFTNTYLEIDKFKAYVNESVLDGIVEIAISTRPDCIAKEYLDILNEVKNKYGINITIELGLQSTNYHTIRKINRGHSFAEYLDAVLTIRKYDFKICTHLILNLPWDDMFDVIEMAKVMSALKMEYVKVHSLYIVKNTLMEKQYKNGEFTIISSDEYKERVKVFLEYLDPKVSIQRLLSRAPKDDVSFMNWHTSWWKIRDEIELEMIKDERYQGKYFNYLGGVALKNKKYI